MAGLAHHLSIKPRLGAPKARKRDLASLIGSSLCWGWRSEVWPAGLGSAVFPPSDSSDASLPGFPQPVLLSFRVPPPRTLTLRGGLTRRCLSRRSFRVLEGALTSSRPSPTPLTAPPPRQETTSSAVFFHFITTHETWRLRRETNKEFSFHLNLAHNPLTN